MKKAIKNCCINPTQSTLDQFYSYSDAYNKCKNLFYQMYHNKLDKIYAKKYSVRNALVKGLKNKTLPVEVYNLLISVPAKLLKNALDEVISNLKSNWSNLKNTIKEKIKNNENLTDKEKHYLRYVLQSNAILSDILREINNPISKFNGLDIIKLNKYLNRLIRKYKFRKPFSKGKSYMIEESQYNYKTDEKGRLWIGLSTLNKGKRVWINLTSKQELSGGLRIVLKGDIIEIHKAIEIKAKENNSTDVKAIDKGFRDLIATSDNSNNPFYGEDLSDKLVNLSDKLNEKNKRRNKIRAVAEKHRKKGFFKKANKIKVHNLGKKKYNNKKRKIKSGIKSFINHSINNFIEEEKPKTVVVEDLTFQGKKHKTKKVNRWLNSWIKGYIQKRLIYKFLVNSIVLALINPAYTSKVCSHCGHFGNRNGANFKCPACTLSINADSNAANNILKRYYDSKISLSTPYKKVKEILLSRLLESG